LQAIQKFKLDKLDLDRGATALMGDGPSKVLATNVIAELDRLLGTSKWSPSLICERVNVIMDGATHTTKVTLDSRIFLVVTSASLNLLEFEHTYSYPLREASADQTEPKPSPTVKAPLSAEEETQAFMDVLRVLGMVDKDVAPPTPVAPLKVRSFFFYGRNKSTGNTFNGAIESDALGAELISRITEFLSAETENQDAPDDVIITSLSYLGDVA